MKSIFSSQPFQADGQDLKFGSIILTLPSGVYELANGGGQVTGTSVILNFDADGKLPAFDSFVASDEISGSPSYGVQICALPDGLQVVGNATWQITGAGPIDLSLLVGTTGAQPPNTLGSGTVTNVGDLAQHAVVIGSGATQEHTLADLGTANKVLHGNPTGDPAFGPVVEADLSLSDNTTADASAAKHGFLPKLPGDSSKFLDGAGGFSLPGGTASLATAAVTTATLAAGATESGTLAMAQLVTVMQAVLSSAARIRLYSTAAARAADLPRSSQVPPTPGTQHGVICDLYLDTSDKLTWALSPAAVGGNLDSPITDTIYYAITNLGTGSVAITLTLTYVKEAV